MNVQRRRFRMLADLFWTVGSQEAPFHVGRDLLVAYGVYIGLSDDEAFKVLQGFDWMHSSMRDIENAFHERLDRKQPAVGGCRRMLIAHNRKALERLTEDES